MNTNTAESIRFEVNLTEKDVINLMMYIARTRKSLIIIYLLYLIVFLYYFISSLYSGGIDGLVDNIFLIALFFFFLVFVPVMYYIVGKRSYKNNPRLRETHHYEINRESIYIKGDSFESTFTWEKTAGISENKNSFFIWQQKNIANIVTKRSLTETDIEFLRQMTSIYKRK